MKLVITLKDPDGVYDSLRRYSETDDNQYPEEIETVVEKFVEFGEYVTIELDTETGGAVVLPV